MSNLILSPIEEEIKTSAFEFAKRNGKKIAEELTDATIFLPDPNPTSVFMAGSPGAGKTEFSKNLITVLENNKQRRVVRIDADEVRSLMPGYIGTNSHLFQRSQKEEIFLRRPLSSSFLEFRKLFKKFKKNMLGR